MFAPNVMEIHRIDVEIFNSGPKCLTLPAFETHIFKMYFITFEIFVE